MSVIMPDEEKMNVDDLRIFYEYLFYFVDSEFSKKHYEQCIEVLGKIQGYLLVSDKKKNELFFDKFSELCYLDLFKNLVEINNRDISYGILKTICFLTTNIENENFIKELYSSKIINVVISMKFDAEDELTEFLINFMKTLALKLNKDNIYYFYNYEINDFPLLTTALSFYNSKNPMIRNVVRNIVLQIIKIEEYHLRNFLTAFPFCVYYPHLIFKLREIIFSISKIDIGNNKNIKHFKNLHDDLIDLIFYINDLLSLNIESINYILINTIFNDIIFPTIRILISKKLENVSALMSFYILLLLLYSIKNKFLLDSISNILFGDLIRKDILNLINESKEYDLYSNNIMKSIDFFIKHSDFADINDENWKNISEFMKKETGMNLADGTKNDINPFIIMEDFLKNITSKNFSDCIKNEIIENFKIFYFSKDDCFVIILNLIIYIIYDIYDKNNNNNNNNNINNNINNINKIIDEEFNILNSCDFFYKIEKDKESKLNYLLFDYLIHFLSMSNSIRLTTNEIILSNLKSHIIYIKEKKEGGEEIIKLKFLPKIIEITVQKIVEIKRILSEKEIFRNLSFEYIKEAYEMYIRNYQKKINDLITLPWLLVPLIYSENIDEYPIYLIPNRNKYTILNEYITIYYLYDIINYINGNNNELIKLKEFPLSLQSNVFYLGKQYNISELGDDKASCEYIFEQNGKTNKKSCFIFLTNDTLYLGENLNGNSKSPSDIKILKKIPLRRLLVKFHTKNNTILDLSEFEQDKNKFLQINCYEQNNAITVMNFLIQNKNTAIELEYLLVISFLDDIISKIK